MLKILIAPETTTRSTARPIAYSGPTWRVSSGDLSHASAMRCDASASARYAGRTRACMGTAF
jgi:hypothetical protein